MYASAMTVAFEYVPMLTLHPQHESIHKRSESRAGSVLAENFLEEAAAVSAEKLTLVKRRLKHALHAMDPAGSIPAIHKADKVRTYSNLNWKYRVKQ